MNNNFNILVLGHGRFASGITSSVELIMGKQENYQYLNYDESENMNSYGKKIDSIIECFDYDTTFVFCDLKNGTPFNIMLEKAYRNRNIKVFYGTNLAMIIEALNCKLFSYNQNNSDSIVMQGKENIGILNFDDFEIETPTDGEL